MVLKTALTKPCYCERQHLTHERRNMLNSWEIEIGLLHPVCGPWAIDGACEEADKVSWIQGGARGSMLIDLF